MSATQHKIIVATDFSPSSRLALEQATWFADIFHSEILLLSVVEAPKNFFGSVDESEEQALRKVTEKKLLDMIHASSRVNISMLLRSGKPWREIVSAGEEHLAEMIFMGTSGVNTMSEMLLGSNAGRVARMANCTVVTVHPGAGLVRPVNRVMVTVDPQFGIRELREFFATHPAWRPAVELISVLTTADDNLQKMEEHLRRQQEMLVKLGFSDVSFKVLRGDVVASAILTHAEANKDRIDMIMMETKGRRGIQGWFIGSVTEEVISFAPMPVLSLKPDRRDDHTQFHSENFPV
jgi:nucleotide-binding universal stress UspA family protein